MLAFLRLFLKFYLADTPHRRNAQHFGGGSEQLTQFHCILADTPHRRNAQHFGGGSEQLTQFHCILADTPHRRNAQHFGGGSELIRDMDFATAKSIQIIYVPY